jgi:hypothetical protein
MTSLFQSKAVPSDTDYRIYTDYGNITAGIDTAFYKYGQRYHTHMDSFENFAAGSAQTMGDNAWAMIRHLASMDTHFPTDTQDATQRAVFYDLIGYYLVAMNLNTATMLNTAVMSISLILLLLRGGITFRSLIATPLTFIGSIIVPISVATVLILVDHPMSFYQYAYYPLLLYGIPAVLGFFTTISIMSRIMKLDQEIAFNAVWLFITLILAVLTYFELGSACIPMFYASAFSLASLFKSRKLSFIILMVPQILVIHSIFLALDMFIPVMGRIGALPADIIVAVITGYFMWTLMLIVFPYVIQENKLHVPKYTFSTLILLTISMILVSCFVLFPYSRIFPKRLTVQHVFRFVQNDTADGNQVKATNSIIIDNSYIGLSGMDPISETYIPREEHFSFDYNHSHPVFVIPTFAMTPPIKRPLGWYTYNTLETPHGNLVQGRIIHPFVSLSHDHDNNRTHLTIDESDARIVPFFSTEMNVYAKKPMTTSFGDDGPRIDKVVTSNGKTLHCHKWFHLWGAASDRKELIQKIWFSSDSSEPFHGIVRVEIVAVVTQDQFYTAALNDTGKSKKF